MVLRQHFERRASELANLATLEVSEQDGAAFLRLVPRATTAVSVVLYLLNDILGTVALDEQACAPAELGENTQADLAAIDEFIDLAVTGRATAFHLGSGGCIEERGREGKVTRSWNNAWPWPGWKHRATRVDYAPYT